MKTGFFTLEEQLELRKLRKAHPDKDSDAIGGMMGRSEQTIRQWAKKLGCAFERKQGVKAGTKIGPYSEDRVQKVRDGLKAARERRGTTL